MAPAPVPEDRVQFVIGPDGTSKLVLAFPKGAVSAHHRRNLDEVHPRVAHRARPIEGRDPGAIVNEKTNAAPSEEL